MILPDLPDYLSSLGGAQYKGLIISLFTITAMLSRPFSGKLTDTIGRVPVMLFGVGVSVACSLVYPMVTGIYSFFMLRFLHGFSTGFQPTATSAFVADVVPAQKRGEAIGILGVFSSVGMATGPTIGPLITAQWSLSVMFYTSTVLGLLSVLVLFKVKETLANKQPLAWRHLRINRHEVVEPRVLQPAIVMVLTVYSFGVMLTITPDFSKHLGLDNGLFITVTTVASLLMRIVAGKASDRYGRVAVLRFSTFITAMALLTVSFADTPAMYLTGAVLFGLGIGMNYPSLFAWAIDLGQAQFIGRAVATVYIALELGIGSGAFISGLLYGNKAQNFPIIFQVAAGCAFTAFLFMVLVAKNRKIV